MTKAVVVLEMPCRLLGCMFTVVCKGFAWVCVRMVTVFDELHDYFRKELCSHGYCF